MSRTDRRKERVLGALGELLGTVGVLDQGESLGAAPPPAAGTKDDGVAEQEDQRLIQAERDTLREDCQKLQEQLAETERDLDLAQEETQRALDNLHHLEQSLEGDDRAEHRAVDRLARERQVSLDLRAELRESKDTLKQLRERLSDVESQHHQAIATYDERLAAAQDKASAALRDLEDAQSLQEKSRDERRKMEKELETAKKALAPLREKMGALQAETESFRKKLLSEVEIVRAETSKQLADKDHEMERNLEKQRRITEGRIDGERRRVEQEAQRTAKEQKKEIAKLRAQLDQTNATCKDLEEQLHSAQEALTIAQKSSAASDETDENEGLRQRLKLALEAQQDLLEALEEEQIAKATSESEARAAQKRLEELEAGQSAKASEELAAAQSNYEMVQALLESNGKILEEREEELLNALKQIGRLRREIQELEAHQAPIELTAESMTAIPPMASLETPSAQPLDYMPMNVEDWDTHVGAEPQPTGAEPAIDTLEAQDFELPKDPQRLLPGNQVFTAKMEDLENDDDTFVRRLKDLFGNK